MAIIGLSPLTCSCIYYPKSAAHNSSLFCCFNTERVGLNQHPARGACNPYNANRNIINHEQIKTQKTHKGMNPTMTIIHKKAVKKYCISNVHNKTIS